MRQLIKTIKIRVKNYFKRNDLILILNELIKQKIAFEYKYSESKSENSF